MLRYHCVFGVILVRIFPYHVQMRENTDENNSEYGHFLRSDGLTLICIKWVPKNSSTPYFWRPVLLKKYHIRCIPLFSRSKTYHYFTWTRLNSQETCGKYLLIFGFKTFFFIRWNTKDIVIMPKRIFTFIIGGATYPRADCMAQDWAVTFCEFLNTARN